MNPSALAIITKLSMFPLLVVEVVEPWVSRTAAVGAKMARATTIAIAALLRGFNCRVQAWKRAARYIRMNPTTRAAEALRGSDLSPLSPPRACPASLKAA